MPKTLTKSRTIDPERLNLESSYTQQLITAGVNTELAKAAAQILAHHPYPLYESELAVLKSAWRQALKKLPRMRRHQTSHCPSPNRKRLPPLPLPMLLQA